MQYEDERAVQFTVSTFKDLRENTEDIIRWFDTYAEKFTYNQRKPQFFSVGYIDGREKIRKANKRNWGLIKKDLYEEEIEDFFLCFYITDNEYKANRFCPDAMLKVILCTKQINQERDRELEKNRNIKRTRANEFTFVMKKDIFMEDIKSIIMFFKETYAQLDGIYGYMDYIGLQTASGASTKSPIETVMGINNFLESNFDRIVRGYFWGNILNETHVEALGGEEYVKSNIPHHKFEVLEFDGKRACYIQLTEDIFTFEPEKYLALKEFLKPLLYEENMMKIAYRDDDGRLTELGRLVFNDEDTAKLLDAQKYSEEELRKIVYGEPPAAEGSSITSGKKEYESVAFTALENADPGSLNFIVNFDAINDDQLEECKGVIESWAQIGLYGGFGESIHYLFGVWKEDNSVSFRVDMGGADPVQALTVLERIVNKFAELNDLIIKEIIIGDVE